MRGEVTLSGPQLQQFGERGYLVVNNAVAANSLAEVNGAIDALLKEEPPSKDTVGRWHFSVDGLYGVPDDTIDISISATGVDGRRRASIRPSTAAATRTVLRRLLVETPVVNLAKRICGVEALEIAYNSAQIALTLPGYAHRPGSGHIDGCELDEHGRPGSFTLLVGVLLSDQVTENSGHLWVWPGTHRQHAAYFRANGPESIATCESAPVITLPEPEQVVGHAGDVVFSHYLLAHNTGGNYESKVTRRCVYYRLRRLGHLDHWREALTDEQLEFDAVRVAAGVAAKPM